MDFRERLWRPRPSAAPYFLSLSRGGGTHAVALAPALFWAFAALIPASLAIGVAGATYFVFHDAGARAFMAHAAEAQALAEGRLAEERGRFDAANSRRLVEHTSFERRLSELVAREARLERRDALVAALASETARSIGRSDAGAPGGALQAIETMSPARRPTALGADQSAVQAYAPVAGADRGPPPSPQSPPLRPANPTAAAAHPDLDDATRLNLAGTALARLESGQMISLAAIDRAAMNAVRQKSAILAEAGLEPERFASAKATVRAPFLSTEAGPDATAFDRAAPRVADEVAMAQGLHAAFSYVPLRKPLLGDARVTSPFGYRADPFLGRPMLHPGIDLLEPYGAEIHATAAGRVVYAGSMGGYGTMVEIDHGNGLVTRYAHMSEIEVQEGQEVVEGALLGRLGSTGRSTGPHLHYEVRVDGEPVDPERFLRAGEGLAEAN